LLGDSLREKVIIESSFYRSLVKPRRVFFPSSLPVAASILQAIDKMTVTRISYREVVDMIRLFDRLIWRDAASRWAILYRDGREVLAGGRFQRCRIPRTGIVYFRAETPSGIYVFGEMPSRQLYLPLFEV